MKTYNFKYGHGSVSLSLNEEDILAELHGTETPPISDIRSALFASLEKPIDSAISSDTEKSTPNASPLRRYGLRRSASIASAP